jgi:hypothetical protein
LLGWAAAIEVWYDREERVVSLVKEESEEAIKTVCMRLAHANYHFCCPTVVSPSFFVEYSSVTVSSLQLTQDFEM